MRRKFLVFNNKLITGLMLLCFSVLVTSCQSIAYKLDPFTSFIGEIGRTMDETGLSDVNPIAGLVADGAKSLDSLNKVMLDVDPELEYIIGRTAAATILEQYKLYENDIITKYLNKICMSLTINSPKPYLYKGYYVGIIDTDEINAISTPGGHILISKGLINAANSEDALAAVIAHELSHIQLGHSTQCIKDIRKENLKRNMAETGTDIFGVIADNVDSEEFNDVFNFISGIKDVYIDIITKGYPKEQEYDADSNAVALLVSAGYNPYALLDMLEEIAKHKTYSNSGWEKTHPAPELRFEKIDHMLRIGGYETVDMSPRVSRFNSFKCNFRSSLN